MLTTLAVAFLADPTIAPEQAPEPPPAQTAPAPPPPPIVYTPAPPPPSALAPVARAPGERLHDGFYLRFALGLGAVGVSGSDPAGHDASIRGGGASLLLALGGTPSPGLVVGGALAGVSNANRSFTGAPVGYDTNTWSGGFGALDAFVDWFPDPTDGWHLGGMFGFAAVQADESTSNRKWIGPGANLRIFGGYDFWVGSQLSIGLGAAIDTTTSASLQDEHQKDTGYALRGSAFTIDVSLLWH